MYPLHPPLSSYPFTHAMLITGCFISFHYLYLIFTSPSLNCYTMQYLTSNTSHPQSQLLYISPYPFSLHSSPSNMHLITISIPTVPHLQHLSSPVSTTLYLTSPLQSPLLTLKHAPLYITISPNVFTIKPSLLQLLPITSTVAVPVCRFCCCC